MDFKGHISWTIKDIRRFLNIAQNFGGLQPGRMHQGGQEEKRERERKRKISDYVWLEMQGMHIRTYVHLGRKGLI